MGIRLNIVQIRKLYIHNFTLKQLYKRYYDTGKFLKENSYLDKYKVNDSGMKNGEICIEKDYTR